MLKRTPIVNRPCKCGCGLPPTIGCRGWNFACLPVLEQIEKRNSQRQRRNKAQQKAKLTKRLHDTQRAINPPYFAQKPPKKRLPISPVSKKRIAELKIYSVLRKDYLRDFPHCQAKLEGCKKKAVDVHHKKSRGIYLNVVEYFLPVCRPCHVWITEHSKKSMELGLTISRLNK